MPVVMYVETGNGKYQIQKTLSGIGTIFKRIAAPATAGIRIPFNHIGIINKGLNAIGAP